MVQSASIFYRVVTRVGRADYDQLMQSGLYATLVAKKLLVEHTEVKAVPGRQQSADDYKILLPTQIPFLSYPYEWSFSQLKDAALLTLEVQKTALDHGLTTKDASAYNVQFLNGRPILIDTLSFEAHQGQRVWTAYRQFCQHFLAPLALMAYVDPSLNLMLRDYIDGLPLALAAKMLPLRRRFKGGLMLHLLMHSSANPRLSQVDYRELTNSGSESNPTNKRNLLGLVDSLERTIKSLQLPSKLTTTWGQYYDITNYSETAIQHKRQLVGEYTKIITPQTIWDLGGNDGTYSRIALESGAGNSVCFDADPLAVEKNYLQIKTDQDHKILPLLLDLTNPSPAIGWANRERPSLTERAGSSNTVMALALIHHLAIANNLPFSLIADYFSRLGSHLIIEFVPKTDSKVQQLLSTRIDIFDQYDQAQFETAFKASYVISRQDNINDSQRTLYLMQRRNDLG